MIITVVFVGFVKKLNSEMIKQVKHDDGCYWLNGKEVTYCEMCGLVLTSTSTSILMCDFYGKTEILKKPDLVLEEAGPHVFTIRFYVRNDTVFGMCKAARRVSIYEEIVFNLELKALVRSLCY